MRRVVTGLDPDGRSIVVSDTEVTPVQARLMPGAQWHVLWSDDTPTAGTAPPEGTRTYFPPAGGVRFGTFTLPPASAASTGVPDRAAAESEMDAVLPGLRATLTGDPSGRHATDTVDFELVLSGEVTLELPGGSRTRLHPGDSVVQNGAVHRWSNDGDLPAVIALVMLGVHP